MAEPTEYEATADERAELIAWWAAEQKRRRAALPATIADLERRLMAERARPTPDRRTARPAAG